MKKKIISAVLIVVLLVVASLILYHNFRDRDVYTLAIPTKEHLDNIIVEKNDGEILNFTKDEDIKKLLDVFGDVDLVTADASINDYPVNGHDVVTINLNYNDGNVVIFYYYEKDDEHFFEQPYNGIYKLNKSNYRDLDKILKK